MMLANAVGLAGPPYLVGRAIDALTKHGTTALAADTGQLVLWFSILIVLTQAMNGVLWIVLRRLVLGASWRLTYEVRRDIFNKLTSLDQSYFFQNRTGDLMNRLTSDLNMVRETTGFGALHGASTAFIMVMSLALMFALSPSLATVVLAVFPFIGLVLYVLIRVIGKRYVAAQEQASVISAKAQENFSGARVVKGYAIEDRELQEYRNMNVLYRKLVLHLTQVEAPIWPLVGMLLNIVVVGVLLVGAKQLIGQNQDFAGLSLGKFAQFTFYLFNLQWPLLAIGMISSLMQRGASSWQRLYEILETKPKIQDDNRSNHSISSLSPSIRFENVSLEVDGRKLLQNINLNIPAGQTIGITGRTGAGKSLLANLVGRLLEPSFGKIFVGGHELPEIPLAVLRRHIGYVPQEPFLFSTTISENIAFGLANSTQTETSNNLDMERVRWAAGVAGLAKDVEAFPNGYETMLGERGVTLSGGQRQRTALARAVARQPEILILDDSMSAVDTETEARILNELKTLLHDRTVLLIGHRVSTLRFADQIVVLEDGKIIEQGSHEELLARGGVYSEMDRKQGLAGTIEEDENEITNTTVIKELSSD